MKINALIKKINRELPEAKAVSTKEWDGNDGGIWFRGSEDYVEADERMIFGGMRIMPMRSGLRVVRIMVRKMSLFLILIRTV